MVGISHCRYVNIFHYHFHFFFFNVHAQVSKFRHTAILTFMTFLVFGALLLVGIVVVVLVVLKKKGKLRWIWTHDERDRASARMSRQAQKY